jgi:cytidylate kinase
MAQARSIPRILDEQVKRWQIAARAARTEQAPARPVIAISRQRGSGGHAVAARLAARLSLDLFDRDLIHEVAVSSRLAERVIESLDEKGQMAVDEWVLHSVSSRHLMPDQYLEHLMKVVGTIGRHGGAVIVGRGAGFIIPGRTCLRARIVAPLEFRVRAVAGELGVAEDKARRVVLSTDADRAAFVQKHFHAAIDDDAHYDLVVNTATFTADAAADLIARAAESACGGRP